jgi:hypothetical protein
MQARADAAPKPVRQRGENVSRAAAEGPAFSGSRYRQKRRFM